MTHRGPFQPLLFCDSFCDSVDLWEGSKLDWKVILLSETHKLFCFLLIFFDNPTSNN